MCVSFPCAAADLEDTPLFANPESGDCLTGGQLDYLLHSMLVVILRSSDLASQHTVHSFRRYLATALVNSRLPPPVVQAICRWQTEQSVREYGQLDRTQYAAHLRSAASAVVNPVSLVYVPPIDPHDHLDGLQDPVLAQHAARYASDDDD